MLLQSNNHKVIALKCFPFASFSEGYGTERQIDKRKFPLKDLTSQEPDQVKTLLEKVFFSLERVGKNQTSTRPYSHTY